ncbi:MAG: MopE-related protein [Anaeromyxobacteraceae bacterium]
MATSPRRHRLLAGLVPIALVAGALPLLAPTCGGTGEGAKTFARYSLVIPMDRCYQSMTDASWTTTSLPAPSTCPQAMDPGDVVKAYGLVYQLIRNDVAVYWVINGTKTKAADEDFRIQWDGGAPAVLYDWATGGKPGASSTPPTTQHVVAYRGGPFVVDGSDFEKASGILQQYKTTFQNVNVHVANVAFSGFVKKVMAGGWSAGGSVPPKLALLNIGSGNRSSSNPPTISDPKNAEPVISGYLSKAGIGSGTAAGTATGTHGEIYDRLGIDDFQPAAGSTDWKTSNFGKNGYQILWVPHWLAPGSCSDYSSGSACAATLYSSTKTDQVLKTIGGFVAAGGDLFAECAGLGSFEGTFTRDKTGQATTTYTSNYQDGDPSTRFQSTTGLRYSESGNEVSYTTPIRFPDPTNASAPADTSPNFASPLLQIGDFVFKPQSGAVDVFRPNLTASPAGAYQPGTLRLISAQAPNDLWDFFTVRPTAGTRGTIVYLGGHSYSDSNFQIGGTRLVLNTLFNLGAGCTASGVACDTGKLGVCALGRLQCAGDPPAPTCVQVNQPSAEICDGLDNDCNGLVDEGLETACYDGPAGTKNVGLCREGVRQCVQNPDGSFGMSACVGEVVPAAEVCNALDDNCNGQVDENLTEACYDGSAKTIDNETGLPKGVCKQGVRTCTEGNWGACVGQVLPTPEVCTEGNNVAADEDCDGFIDNAACVCSPGQVRQCYTGPAGTAGVGTCKVGTQSCGATGWGACTGEVVPLPAEICTPQGGTPADENCNGQTDEGCGQCQSGTSRSCYDGPASSTDGGGNPRGVCKKGTQACVNGKWEEACAGETLPSPADPCDGLDNDCDGVVDDGAVCAPGYQCEVGVCVPSVCGTEQPCPEGYGCQSGSGCKQQAGGCGGVTCPPGESCRFGACSDPCAGVTCGQGSTCVSGSCTGGACYFTGCPTGQLCRQGACEADPCAGMNCPSGTFCREGLCVQACTFVSCKAGERCGDDGFCVVDACAGITCAAGKLCVEGVCRDDTCTGVGCGRGQVCKAGFCVDDPCAGVTCPAGACVDGQCYSVANPGGSGGLNGDGTTGQKAKRKIGGCGCGAGGGQGPIGALLALLAVPLARRRRAPRAGGGALLVLAVAALAAASGCKKTAKFDPSKCETTCPEQNRCIELSTDAFNCGACAQVCGDGNRCVDGVCGPASAVAPFITSISPAAADNGGALPVTVTVTGERFGAGAKLRTVNGDGELLLVAPEAGGSSTELRYKLDLSVETPTTWYVRVLNPDNVVSNARALDITVPSPTITQLTPSAVLTGAVSEITVSGTGLGGNSQCRLSSPQLLTTSLPTEATADGKLECTVDATLLPPSTEYALRVVNIDPATGDHASLPAKLTIASPKPTLTAISPSITEAGAFVTVTLGGTGFNANSKALFDEGKATAATLNTTFLDPTQLLVANLKMPSCASGTCSHTLAVRNDEDPLLTSQALTILAGGQPPVVSGLSPGTGYQGETVVLTLAGSGFTAGSFLEAAPPGGSFTALTAPGTPNCPGACDKIVGTLDLTGKPDGAWQVRATYAGGGTSAPFSFRVLSNVAVLRDASPRGGAQGATVPVVLTASNLRAPFDQIRVVFDGQALVPTSTPVGSPPTTVNVSLVLTGKNTGTYNLAVRNAGATDSNTITFNVTPGQPTLTSVSPTAAPRQTNKVKVTLTGTNFAKPDALGNGGSAVHISNAAIGVTDFAVPKTDTTVVSATSIEVMLDTLAAIPAKYDVAVYNPGGPTPPQKSNVLTQAFEVQP